jgi:transcriptional regulator with XRE-family HTH domain
MSATESSLYKAFGDLVVQLRLKSGLAQQSDLAALMGTTQQTVSRWESGASRPRDKQMPRLASVLNADLSDLLAAARYTTRLPVATYDQPFPLDALNPESFERFCFYFLSQKYSAADVHRAGGPGHTQEGLDIEVIFTDGSCFTFQCKRVDQFGPGQVHKAVDKHTRTSTKKFLLLARVASTQARQAIGEYEDWDIWDREDISRIIRQDLSKDQQYRLIDTYFRGQRLALLGDTEAGPWQTTERFFAPFIGGQKAFSHQWQLAGRVAETSEIVTNLSNSTVRVTFLIGAGGSGKSRVLKQCVENFELKHRAVLIRFLSPSEDVTDKSLEDLGRGLKLLVVDDAHDRNDLRLLFQYAATLENNTALLLSFRPYGLEHIKSQASNFTLVGENVSETKLNPLTLEEATQLATQVLEEFGGPAAAAKEIARLTLECPLATVIGAQVVAKEKINLEFAKNEDVFRSTLLGKFQDIIAGDIGSKGDAEPIKKLLKILALIQPFHPEDESIAHVVERVEGLDLPEVNRLVRLLADAGVLFKRSGKFRLSPDLLADYIIEQACIGQNGKSTGYAERVFDASGNAHLEQILVNLGKLDWRRANGDPSNSRLLDGIWQKLKPAGGSSDPYISAVTAVAYYQPGRTLDFADHLIREGKFLRDLPNLIKYAAYNFDHLPRACQSLWALGKSDSRALNQHPGHAIRILSELCAVEPNKPIEYSEVVVEFGLSLLNQAASWRHAYTPFDLLTGILQTEGHTTTSNGRNITLEGYRVSFDAVSALRGRVIDAAINLLTHANTRIAVLAAKFLQEGLRFPMGILKEQISTAVREPWAEEFAKTLEKIEGVTKSDVLDPLVFIELVRSVSWHAQYSKGKISQIAKRIIAALPQSLEFRATLALIEGYGHLLVRKDYEQQEQDWNQYLTSLTSDLILEFPDGETLRSFVEHALAHIEQNHADANASPYVLYGRLIQSSDTLAGATVENVLQSPLSKTKQFAGIALSKILVQNHSYALSIAQRFLGTDSRDLHAAVGRAYGACDLNEESYSEEDLTLLRQVLSSKDQWVARSAVESIRSVVKSNKSLAIELLKYVDLSISSDLADAVLLLFQRDEMIPFRLLTGEDIEYFLKKLMSLPELDGHWIQTFLSNASKYHAQRAATFFMERVEHAVKSNDWRYRPCNSGPYRNVPLRFRESEEFGSILRQVTTWMKSDPEGGYKFDRRAGELFNAMFGPFDGELLGFIQDWIDVGTAADMRIISQIFNEVHSNFVFEQRIFVFRFLDRAGQHGREVLDDAVSALFRSAITGPRSGTPGEPFPQDLVLRDEAEKVLQEIPRFAPAYRLYEALKNNAKENINGSLRERETFEEDG